MTTLETHPAHDFRDPSPVRGRLIRCCDCGWFQIVKAQSPESALRAFLALGWRRLSEFRFRCPGCAVKGAEAP